LAHLTTQAPHFGAQIGRDQGRCTPLRKGVATAKWVDWSKHHRHYERCGEFRTVELENAYYALNTGCGRKRLPSQTVGLRTPRAIRPEQG
jgi:hypothetical protein